VQQNAPTVSFFNIMTQLDFRNCHIHLKTQVLHFIAILYVNAEHMSVNFSSPRFN